MRKACSSERHAQSQTIVSLAYSPLRIQELSYFPGSTEADLQTYQFFHKYTAAVLSQLHESTHELWLASIHQYSHSQEIIWHLCLSVGGAQQAVVTSTVEHSNLYQNLVPALKHRSQALKLLNEQMASLSRDILLLASALLLTFDNFGGQQHSGADDQTAGAIHLTAGMKLIREMRMKQEMTPLRSTLEPCMLEMDLVASMFRDARHVISPKLFGSPSLDRPTIPSDGFMSLEEAKVSLLAILRWRFTLKSYVTGEFEFASVQNLLQCWLMGVSTYQNRIDPASPDYDLLNRCVDAFLTEYVLVNLSTKSAGSPLLMEVSHATTEIVDISHPNKVVVLVSAEKERGTDEVQRASEWNCYGERLAGGDEDFEAQLTRLYPLREYLGIKEDRVWVRFTFE